MVENLLDKIAFEAIVCNNLEFATKLEIDASTCLNRFFAWYALLIFISMIFTTAVAKVSPKPLKPFGCVLSTLNDVHILSGIAMTCVIAHAIMCVSGNWVAP